METAAAAVLACAAGFALASRRRIWERWQRAEEHPHEWLFSALAHSRRDIVVKGDPDVSWNEVHPTSGTPLHCIGSAGIRLAVEGYPYYDWTLESAACIKDLFALFEFALQRGADPGIVCPRTCSCRVRFVVEDLYDLSEPIAGRSPISLWLALSQKAQALDAERPLQLPLASSLFDGVLALLLNKVPKHRGLPLRSGLGSPAMVDVPEASTTMWQRVMDDEDSADVVLVCPDGEVRVHSAVAASSSKVLSAMLRWPRQDGDPKEPLRVSLEDRRRAVAAWRVLIYTGLPPEHGLPLDLLLEVLEISHRWNDHLLEGGLLEAALAKRVVDADSCQLVLEAAVTRDLPELKAECLAFARRSRDVRRLWEEGSFSAEATRQLDLVLRCGGAGGSRSRSQGGRSGSGDGQSPSPRARRRRGGGGGGGPQSPAPGGRAAPAPGRWDL